MKFSLTFVSELCFPAQKIFFLLQLSAVGAARIIEDHFTGPVFVPGSGRDFKYFATS